ncbi:MAG: GIY-YIG nuclease family protein [Myxococcales bacterium]|nr:GIY-YIG nuclease family protein [Myxococcales bacterium]
MAKPAPSAPIYFVYLLRCADKTLYTGIARDVAKRLAEHNAGKGAKYTRGRGPLRLLATAACADRASAQRLEAAVKAQPRAQKLAFLRAQGAALATRR